VILDVNGYYSQAGHGAYLPTVPTRLIDTRTPMWGHGPLPSGYYLYMPLSSGMPDISAFVLNSPVTDTKGVGYLAVAPDPNSLSQYQQGTNGYIPPPPTVSTLNWLKGKTVPNLVQAGAGANGIIDFWNRSNGSLDLVVDAMGYYMTD
jgi:hypothetical protein